MILSPKFRDLVKKGIWDLASRIVVRTGYMRQNFIDAFEIKETDKTISIWFDNTRFHQLVPYAMRVMGKHGIMYPFATAGASGKHPVNLKLLNIDESDFDRKVMIQLNQVAIL